MTTTQAPPKAERAFLKYSCGLCAAKRHDLCPGAVFSPGAGEILVAGVGSIPPVRAGLAQWCPCTSTEHSAERTTKCRNCSTWSLPEDLNPDLTCLDAADCAIRIQTRLEDDPLHQLIVECQTTRVVAGETVERPRRATPVQREKAKAERKAAQARPCTCGCEGTTKGGAFLPGHDARFISQLAKAGNKKAARAALAPFPKLLAKYERKLA